MSQEKVDKRKYEKYHRKEIQKKQKRKAMIATVVFVLVAGTAIGIPLGYKIYDMIPKKVSANEVVYNAWVSNYIQQMDGYPFVPDTTEDNTENNTEENGTTGEASDNSAEEASDNSTEASDSSTEEASDNSTAANE
ncbi:MAG: hypothetical protein K2G89_03020 [Lachnospiraceae bacterium]|nr:hypothetical protein [Lachnospiraceae bacterium]